MIPTFLAVLQLSSAVPDTALSGPYTREYDGSSAQTEIATPRFPNPSVSVDGRIDEAVWGTVPVLTGFTQYDPSEGVSRRRSPQRCASS